MNQTIIKLKISLLLIASMAIQLQSQQMMIGDGNPDPSSLLEIKSNSKGFLMPRMTSAEINAIENPSSGLQVYCLDDDCIHIYNGTGWTYNCAVLYEGTTVHPPDNPSVFYNQSSNTIGNASWSPTLGLHRLDTTTADAQGAFIVVPNELTPDQIIDAILYVDPEGTGNRIPPHYTVVTDREYDYWIQSDGDIIIINHRTNSSAILSKPLTIEIIYKLN